MVSSLTPAQAFSMSELKNIEDTLHFCPTSFLSWLPHVINFDYSFWLTLDLNYFHHCISFLTILEFLNFFIPLNAVMCFFDISRYQVSVFPLLSCFF